MSTTNPQQNKFHKDSSCKRLFVFSSAGFCDNNPTLSVCLFQAKNSEMSFLFDWIYRGFSSVLQFLGKLKNDLTIIERY